MNELQSVKTRGFTIKCKNLYDSSLFGLSYKWQTEETTDKTFYYYVSNVLLKILHLLSL